MGQGTTNWTTRLKNLADNIGTIADSQSVYLHRDTATFIHAEKAVGGGLRVEVPVPQAKLSKVFLIGASRGNIALKIKMGKKHNPIEKVMVFGEEAFEELWEIFNNSMIVGRPPQKISERKEYQESSFRIMDKVNGLA